MHYLLFGEKTKETDIVDNLLLRNHQPIKTNTLIGIEKLNSRQLYSLLVYRDAFTPTSQMYFNILFKTDSLNWTQILSSTMFGNPWQLLLFLSILKSEQCFKNQFHLFALSANFQMRQCSIYFINVIRFKIYGITGFILRKQLHSIWSNTKGCLFRLP